MKNKDNAGIGFFCRMPFENFEVLPDGNVYICCSVWVPTPIGNLKNSSVMDIWNSENAMKIRQSVLDGTYTFCRQQLCGPLQSKMLPERDSIKDPYLREVIDLNRTYLHKGPRIITLDNDRSCNLWCPSCRTSRFVLKGKEYDEAYALQRKLIAEGLGEARVLLVSGSGDPFASRLHIELLASINYNLYPELKITLMTNGMLFTPASWNKLGKARKAVKFVIVSIDAASPGVYRAIRRGGDFDKLLDNLCFISSLRREDTLERLEFHFVVQHGNFREMKDFVALGKGFGADMVVFSRLCNWGTFTEPEYFSRAVHLTNHPDHLEFLNILGDPVFKDPAVCVSNLSEFLTVP